METYDFIVIGSGAGGAVAALQLAQAGSVCLLEEGPHYARKDFRDDMFDVETRVFRGEGTQVTKGSAMYPVLQGVCVGGSTVINGGICHDLPSPIYDEWATEIPTLRNSIPRSLLEQTILELEKILGVGATLKNYEHLPAKRALEKLNWPSQPMKRNAPGCEGSGNCLQGCPTGSKKSLENSIIPNGVERGVVVKSETRATSLLRNRSGNAEGVRIRTRRGSSDLKCRHSVVVSAGVVHSPLILKSSGFKHPLLGQNFQGHLSIGVVGEYSQSVRDIEGQPQGIEAFPPEYPRIKLATQLLPPELLLARTPMIGSELVNTLRRHSFLGSWVGSIRSTARGNVKANWLGQPRIHFSPSPEDLHHARRSVQLISQLMFELGAKCVFPGLFGGPLTLTHPREIESLNDIELHPQNFMMGLGHLFGTCRLGDRPDSSVVDCDGRVWGSKNIYVMDASILPSNVGVNPQLIIMGLSQILSQRLAQGARS